MLVLPFGFLAPAAGAGPTPSGPPVTGYDMWLDLADTSLMSFDGSGYLTAINTKTDTGRSTYTFNKRTDITTNIVYNSGKKAIDGASSTTDWFLFNDAIGDDFFYPGASWVFSSVEQTLCVIASDTSFRGQPFGWEANFTQLQQIFYNDSVGYRSAQLDPNDPFITGVTNDNNKDAVYFNILFNTALSGGDTYNIFRQRDGVEQAGSARPWSTAGFNVGGSSTKLGGTARSIDTFYGFTGYIYAVLQYPFALDSSQRESIRDWAVTYYGLTLNT